MNILIVDTSSEMLAAVLVMEDKVFEHIANAGCTHSESLLVVIDNLLKEAEIGVKDIDLFAGNVGPGSFTGIRIGVATLNAFSYVAKKGVIGFHSFEPFAYNITDDAVFAIDARHGNFYTYDNRNGELTVNTKEYLDNIEEVTKVIYIDSHTITSEALIGAVMSHGDKNLADQLVPLYIRATEAERNAC